MESQSIFWKEYWKSNERIFHENPFVQIGRTKQQQPVNKKIWTQSLDFIKKKMDLSEEDSLLDICCGNGLLSLSFCEYVDKIYAIDYSKELLSSFKAKKKTNINIFHKDVKNFDYSFINYNKVLFYFSIQHFSEKEVVILLKKINNSLSKDGIIYIGDIPDIDLRWNFFYQEQYQKNYFKSLEKGESIIGSWFKRDFFINLSKYLGFTEATIINQPKYMINSNHRFDILLKK